MCLGGAFGLFCGFSVLWTGDDPHHPQGGVLARLEYPVFLFMWVLTSLFRFSDGADMGAWFLFHWMYWALLGGFVFVGVAAGWQKLVGDE